MFKHTRETAVVSQPPRILDLAGVHPADLDPRLLNRVVSFGERAEHPIADGPQVATVDLEALGQHVVLIHRSHSFVGACHPIEPAKAADVTEASKASQVLSGRAVDRSGIPPKER